MVNFVSVVEEYSGELCHCCRGVNYMTAAAGPYGWDADAGDEARSEPCTVDTH